jgi:hypothetical protein
LKIGFSSARTSGEHRDPQGEEERDRQKQRERLLQAHLEVLRVENQLEGGDRSNRYDELTAEQEEFRARREGLTGTDDDVECLRDLKERRDEASMRLEHLVDSHTTVHVGSDLRIHVEPGGKNLGESGRRPSAAGFMRRSGSPIGWRRSRPRSIASFSVEGMQRLRAWYVDFPS